MPWWPFGGENGDGESGPADRSISAPARLASDELPTVPGDLSTEPQSATLLPSTEATPTSTSERDTIPKWLRSHSADAGGGGGRGVGAMGKSGVPDDITFIKQLGATANKLLNEAITLQEAGRLE